MSWVSVVRRLFISDKSNILVSVSQISNSEIMLIAGGKIEVSVIGADV